MLGWLLVYSATYYQPALSGAAPRQALALSLGLFLQWGLARAGPSRLLRAAPWLFLISLVPLAAIPWIGVEVNGARRWLSLGALGSLQPSELVKFTLLLVQTRWIQAGQRTWALAALLPPALLVLRQPDLGTAGCYVAITMAGLFVSGTDLRWLLSGAAAGLAVLSQRLHDYQRDRLLMFLDPERDATGAGWNLIQAKIAVGSGGLIGLGLFQGLQKRLLYVPEQHTDFLFTVLAEELGLLGGLMLLLLYSLLYLRGFTLARHAPTPERASLCAAACAALAFQTAINLAMVLGLFPVTGIPLPFLSYGGTAVLAQCALLGILQAEALEQERVRRLQPRVQWSPRA